MKQGTYPRGLCACFPVPESRCFKLSPDFVDMGRSGKLPSGVSAKLKRWKKGHSSDSNPAICRHRQAARSRFFSRPSGSGVEIPTSWRRGSGGPGSGGLGLSGGSGAQALDVSSRTSHVEPAVKTPPPSHLTDGEIQSTVGK